MNSRRRTCVRRKSGGKDCHSSSQRANMDDHSSAQSFSTHHHRYRPLFHLALPSIQSSELGYPSSQPALDPLEQYGGREDESTVSFLTSSGSSGGRRASNGSDRGLLNISALDGEANFGGGNGIDNHFADPWRGASGKEEVWENGESFESATENFYSKGDSYIRANDVFHSVNCGNDEEIRCKIRANYNNYSHVSYEDKRETVSEQTIPCNKSAAGSLDYCRTNSRLSDHFFGGEEEYGSGSGEDQLQSAEVEEPWLRLSPSSQSGEGRWRGAADTVILASGCLPQRSPISVSSGTYTQKLDSFSEAFLSQRKRTYPVVSSGESAGQKWEFGEGRGESAGLAKSQHSCAFDSDYLPPASSPAHSSLVSFPSPPTSSHIMSSVLSPPPTPHPPPSYSPSKMDSPSVFGGTAQSVSHGEPLSALQFFASHLQSLPSIHSSGMMWKFPLMAHNFPPSSANLSNVQGNLKPSHVGDYSGITASQNILKSPESSFLASLHPPSTPCPSSPSPLHTSFHHPSLQCQQYETEEKIDPYMATQREQNVSTVLNQSKQQPQASRICTGTPFPSILHSGRSQKKGHYTPRPLLNPARSGRGLYSSLSTFHHTEDGTVGGEEEDEGGVLSHINVGHEFQAELPPCLVGLIGSVEEESPREKLLWKSWDELQESTTLQDKVEKLLSVCSSSCLPGGGSNTELALHCLHHCQGDTMATLEMLLFSQPSPVGDYHYSGSDFWTDTEKSLFNATLGAHGKDFSFIQKRVRTKTVRQCVEFYYLNKKLQDKRDKQREEENKDGEMAQQASLTPTCQPVKRPFTLEEVVPVPPLASFFPCKLCGKMFYKIKSRNAHMKIHRQPQEDWADRRLQHQLLTQRLGSNLLPPQAPARAFSSSGLPGATRSSSNAEKILSSLNNNTIAPSNASILDPGATCSNSAVSNSHVITDVNGGDSNRKEPSNLSPFQQLWGSFGNGPDPAALAAFFCNTESKDSVGAGTVGAKEPNTWQ